MTVRHKKTSCLETKWARKTRRQENIIALLGP